MPKTCLNLYKKCLFFTVWNKKYVLIDVKIMCFVKSCSTWKNGCTRRG